MKSKCRDCDAKCCKYVVLDIDAPVELDDFENIKWYVAHENVEVFVDSEGVWNVKFITRCKYLNDLNRCDIYEKRPDVCREFSVKGCSGDLENDNVLVFRTIEEVENYIKNVFEKGKHLVE